jgi:hypothetical protein
MRRFVPGVDSYLGAGVPASLMRFSESDSGEDALMLRSDLGSATVITTGAGSLSEKFRRLCYWRQVINAENN